jgi:hypothetical protein
MRLDSYSVRFVYTSSSRWCLITDCKGCFPGLGEGKRRRHLLKENLYPAFVSR